MRSSNVVFLGMGGSGIAGDIAAAVAGAARAGPDHRRQGLRGALVRRRDDALLRGVLLGQHRGDRSRPRKQPRRPAAGWCASQLGAGWRILRPTGTRRTSTCRRLPMPRAGIGAVSIPPLTVLERVGLFPGAGELVAEAVAQLRRRRDGLVSGDAARRLARRIGRTIPISYGGGEVGAVAANRFKTQVNENAKAPAFANSHPELDHNEICGWGAARRHHPPDDDGGELPPRVRAPAGQAPLRPHRDLLAEVVDSVEEVVAEGDGSWRSCSTSSSRATSSRCTSPSSSTSTPAPSLSSRISRRALAALTAPTILVGRADQGGAGCAQPSHSRSRRAPSARPQGGPT